MRERPILFSGPMVRALLAGTKTQTRRIIRCPLEIGEDDQGKPWPFYPAYVAGGDHEGELATSPYGVPGDRLWVRETFSPWRRTCVESPLEWESLATKEEHGGLTLAEWVEHNGHQDILKCYLADQKGKGEDVYIPSIHMPRWASRITLEITEVRVQRLQDISEEDAIAEGVVREELAYDPDNFHPPGSYGYVSGLHPFPKGMIWPKATEAYKELWESINGPGSWEANPWVWALTFKMVQP